MVVGKQTGSQSTRSTDRVFHALSDPTRRDILRRVVGREETVSGLAAHYPMSFAAVQKHVAVLEDAGLVRKRRAGRTRLVTADTAGLDHVRALLDDLERTWRHRIDRMGEILAETTQEHDR